jgi:hypothetical protein
MSTHSFYFKVVYTCQTINYDIDLDMSISEFLNYVKDKIRHDLGVDNNYEIEIVEAGQFDNVNGRDAEVAPALEHSDTTIREKFNNYNQTAFYIRPVIRSRLSLEQPQIENNSENNIIPTIPR